MVEMVRRGDELAVARKLPSTNTCTQSTGAVTRTWYVRCAVCREHLKAPAHAVSADLIKDEYDLFDQRRHLSAAQHLRHELCSLVMYGGITWGSSRRGSRRGGSRSSPTRAPSRHVGVHRSEHTCVGGTRVNARLQIEPCWHTSWEQQERR